LSRRESVLIFYVMSSRSCELQEDVWDVRAEIDVSAIRAPKNWHRTSATEVMEAADMDRESLCRPHQKYPRMQKAPAA